MAQVMRSQQALKYDASTTLNVVMARRTSLEEAVTISLTVEMVMTLSHL
jgi:hypothetical protein